MESERSVSLSNEPKGVCIVNAKRLHAAILCLCLWAGLALLPGAARAAETYTMDFSKSIDISWGAEVHNINFSTTDASGTGWRWTHANKTLTLTGLTFTTTAAVAMKLPHDTTLALADGTVNAVTSTYAGIDDNSYGLFCVGSLIVSGGGSLTAKGGNPTSAVNSYGVCVWDMNFNSGSLTMLGGTLIGLGGTSMNAASSGVYVRGEITVGGGTLKGVGDIGKFVSIGVHGYNGVAVSGGTLEAIGGTVLSGEPELLQSLGILTRNDGVIALSGGTTLAKGYTGALRKAATLGAGLTAKASTAFDGSAPVAYVADNNGAYLWFKAEIVVPPDDKPVAPKNGGRNAA